MHSQNEKKNTYWGNKRVLITGSTGFIGKHLAQRLEELGATVFGLSRSAEGKNTLRADILNFPSINKFVRDQKISICFHLAAEALVESGQSNPYQTFKSNIDGTLNILESARKNNLKKIVVASTSHVYGDNNPPYIEEYTPKPSRPYETSKTCTDLIAQSYAETFNLPVLIPRFVNTYGPGDLHFNRLIPKTIKSILTNQRLEIWGGGIKRDYLFVDDVVDAYIRLAQLDISKAKGGRIFNFGGGNIISVEELVKKIIAISGKKVNIQKIEDARPLEIKAQYVSSEKALKTLGWKAKVSLDKGLSRTYLWYRDYFAKK